MSYKVVNVLFVLIAVVFVINPCVNAYVPWDYLSEASWIDFGDTPYPNMYPVNGGTGNILSAYPIGFSPAGSGNKAKGMNALKFGHGGLIAGHMVSSDQRGSFTILNSGDNNVFTDVLILVAIDTEYESLENGFGMTLGLQNQQPYVFEPNDFTYYDGEFGRPSGYYYSTRLDDPHATEPDGDPIAYAFEKGTLSVWAIEGLDGLPPGGSVVIEYSFEQLPAPAVFSVYGYVGTDPLASIYHTNRAFVDANDSKRSPVSTFAVTIAGDINKDLKVDLEDFAILAKNWLKGVR